jgi:hypothetical protein
VKNLAIGDFYTQVIAIAAAAIVILSVLWKRCNDTIDKLENTTSQEGYLITSYIWSTDIMRAVERFFSFVQENIVDLESEDKFLELFSDEEKTTRLKSDLDALDKSYRTYLDVYNLYPNLLQEHEEQRKWIMRTVGVSFAFAFWGAAGLLFEVENEFLTSHQDIFWLVFAILLFLLATCVSYLAWHNRKCGKTERNIRKQKSKYSDIIKKVA